MTTASVYFRAPNHHNDAINDINDKDNDGQTVASLFFFYQLTVQVWKTATTTVNEPGLRELFLFTFVVSIIQMY